MIVVEDYTADSGMQLKRRYSDSGKYIKNAAGDLYMEAIDPADVEVEYTETEIEIEQPELTDAEFRKMVEEVL